MGKKGEFCNRDFRTPAEVTDMPCVSSFNSALVKSGTNENHKISVRANLPLIDIFVKYKIWVEGKIRSTTKNL